MFRDVFHLEPHVMVESLFGRALYSVCLSDSPPGWSSMEYLLLGLEARRCRDISHRGDGWA
ncbi:MAG: hypothetical protein CM1200mP9_07200 [Gammaproteobacteria bacterium]|nr:MAG: hypothetical protein CM1200mP9_07200 [Gammaproteobacteria bacterium]